MYTEDKRHEIHSKKGYSRKRNAIFFLSASNLKLFRLSVEVHVALNSFMLYRYLAIPQQSFTHAICVYTL